MSAALEPSLSDSNLLSRLKCCDDIIDSFYDFRNVEDPLDFPLTCLREPCPFLLGKHETGDTSINSSRSSSPILKEYLDECLEEHEHSNLQATIEGKSTTREEAGSIKGAIIPKFFLGENKIAADPKRDGNRQIASLCALCIVEGALEASNQSVRKGRGQLCDRHIEAIESRNVFEARFCMYMAAPGEGHDPERNNLRRKTFKLTSKRASLHKLLTFTSDDNTVSANLLRIHISPRSSSGFPYHQHLFCMHPHAMGNHATRVQYQSLVSSETFKPLSGPDHPVLAYKASNGRIAMFKFSGLAAQSSGAIDTGLYCTRISSPGPLQRRDSSNFEEHNSDLETMRRHILATHRQMVNLAHLIPEAFTSKVRIIDTQPDGRTWFQLPLTSRELQEFDKCLSTLKSRHIPTLSLQKPLEISKSAIDLKLSTPPPEGKKQRVFKEKEGWEKKSSERDKQQRETEVRERREGKPEAPRLKRKRKDGIQGETMTPKLHKQRLVSKAGRPEPAVVWSGETEGVLGGWSPDLVPLSLPLCAFSSVLNSNFIVEELRGRHC